MRYLKLFIEFNRTVKSRPTKYFFFLIILFFGLFFQAYMHNYNIVYIVLFFTFALSGSSCLVGRMNLFSLEIEPLLNEEIFAQNKTKLFFKLHNSSKTPAFALSFEKSYIQTIRAQSFETVSVEKEFANRGYNYVKDLEVVSFFPFGHIKFSKKFPQQLRYLVYAKPQGISLYKAFAKELSYYGEIDSYEDLKEYEKGESLAKIHWASVAKGELKSKKFTYQSEDKTLHFYFHKAGKTTEQRVSQLTLWVLQAKKEGVEYIIHIQNKKLDSKKQTKNEILKKLALY